MAKYIGLPALALALICPGVLVAVAKLLVFGAAVGALWSWAMMSRHNAITSEGVSCNGDTSLFGETFWFVTTLTILFPPTAYATIPLAILIRVFA